MRSKEEETCADGDKRTCDERTLYENNHLNVARQHIGLLLVMALSSYYCDL